MLDNSAVTGMVDRLEKRSFVRRRGSPRDRRAINVYLTDAGYEAATKALSVVEKYNNEVKKGFSLEEIDAFRRILQSVIDRFALKKNCDA